MTLRQALAGLMPPPAAAPALDVAIPPAAVALVAANPPFVDAPLANNDNDGG